MKTIYKYQLTLSDSPITMPKGAEILTVKLQNDTPTLWALIDTYVGLEESRLIVIRGTGHHIEDNAKYIATYVDGPFVWHIFELTDLI
tara:strand:- start:81 stop:344 length:264 start_codon:yes stop_codon:yes gene_type:complete